jgi:hypothetical protein
MEAIRMKPIVMLLSALLLAGLAHAGDVYVTRDAKGNPVYTDTPQTLPAQKVGIHSVSSDPAEVQARYEEQMKKYAADDAARSTSAAAAADATKARTLNAEDQARRCVEARQRYEAVINSFRLYEEGPDGERRYLTADEIDTARAEAKRMVDEFCGAQ